MTSFRKLEEALFPLLPCSPSLTGLDWEERIRRKPYDFPQVPESAVTTAMCESVVTKYPRAVAWMHDKHRTQTIWESAVRTDQWLFPDCPDEMKSDAMIDGILPEWGWMLEHVPYSKRTVERCRIAMAQTREAFDAVPAELKTDTEITLLNTPLGDIPKKDRTLMLCQRAAVASPMELDFVPLKHRSRDFYMGVFKENKNTFPYIPTEYQTPEMQEEAVLFDKSFEEYLVCIPRIKRARSLSSI